MKTLFRDYKGWIGYLVTIACVVAAGWSSQIALMSVVVFVSSCILTPWTSWRITGAPLGRLYIGAGITLAILGGVSLAITGTLCLATTSRLFASEYLPCNPNHWLGVVIGLASCGLLGAATGVLDGYSRLRRLGRG